MVFEVQGGLPPYGPEALPFSATGVGTRSEGYVVKVYQAAGTEWIGNFQPGLSGFNSVFHHPDGERIIVIAGGLAYAVNIEKPGDWSHFGGQIEFAECIEELQAILIGNGLWFELHGKESLIWKSRRMSWDGMRDIRIEGVKLYGSAWTYHSPDTWSPFELDLSNGSHVGGTYTGPD